MRDDHGRFAIGFCGPDCLMSEARDEALAAVERHRHLHPEGR